MSSVQHDLGEALRSTCMLAACRTKAFGLMRTDRAASTEISAAKNAKADAARVQVSRLAGADEFHRAVTLLQGHARQTFDRYTLPWDGSGWRMLPTTSWEPLMLKLNPVRERLNETMAEYRANIPSVLARARAAIGDYQIELPTEQDILGAYDFKVEFQPIPDGRNFNGLTHGTLEALSRHIESRCRAGWAQAHADVCDRVGTVLSNIVQRLGAYEEREASGGKGKSGTFRNSTIDALTELAVMLPTFNVIGDQQLTELTTEIQRLATGVTPESVREDASQRAQVLAQAQSIIDRMGMWRTP
jgi:hypothetical protein